MKMWKNIFEDFMPSLCLEITLKSLSRKLNELNEPKIVAMGSSVSRARFEHYQNLEFPQL